MNSKTKAEALRRLSGFVMCAKCEAPCLPHDAVWHTNDSWRLRRCSSVPYCSMFCALTATPRSNTDALMTRVQWIDDNEYDEWPTTEAIRLAVVMSPSMSWDTTDTGESAWLAENAARLREAGEIR